VEPDVHRRRFPRIENLRDTMREWAPYHFLLMLEALRDEWDFAPHFLLF
jgi:hypothetical protein